MKTEFKKTELGDIPVEWNVVSFQEVTQIITCGLAATPTYVSESVGKPFLSAQNIQNGRVVFENFKFISLALFEQITRHNKPQRGDLLYTRVGAGIGEAGVIENDYEFGIYVSLTLIRTDSRKLYNHYTAYLLNSPRYRLLAKGGQFAGGGVQNLNVDVVRKFPIPLPPLNEQRAIAATLGDADILLEALERLITKKRRLKQAAMQQLLTGAIRLTGFHNDWIVATVATLSEYVFGISTQGGDSGYVEIGDIDVALKTYDVSRKDKLSVRGSIKVPKGTLLISTVRPTRGAIAITKEDIFVSNAFCRIRPRNDLLFHIVCQDRFLSHLGEISTGGTYPTCRDADILSYECLVPSDPEEQTAIAAILSDMDAELAALDARLNKTRALKQAMMSELLTGKTRLPT